jgi:hypothetical protein
MTSRLIFGLILLGVAVAGATVWLWTSSTEPVPQTDGHRTVKGETETLYDGTVAAWAELNADGTVVSVGATMELATIRNAPTPDAHEHEDGAGGHHHAESGSIRLAFPNAVKRTTYFDHLQFDYVPTGHPPAAYEVPHFDFHFYGITTEAQLAVDCTDRTMPPDELVPSGYQVLPPRPESEGGGCVPKMGIHAIDVDAPELREDDPAPFTQTMILGYYGGELTFLEPMATKPFLLKREGFATSVPVPDRLGRSTRFPTAFNAVYDDVDQAYRLIWTDFVTTR